MALRRAATGLAGRLAGLAAEPLAAETSLIGAARAGLDSLPG